MKLYFIFSGWFIQSEENDIKKEYNYSLCGSKDAFVQWEERTIKNGLAENFVGIVYVERPYLTAVDVTERRNLTYTFRLVLKYRFFLDCSRNKVNLKTFK